MMSLNQIGQLEEISDKRINHAINWATDFVTTKREVLIHEGILYKAIYDEYKNTTRWPVGHKSFGPILHLLGLTKIVRNGKTVYVLCV